MQSQVLTKIEKVINDLSYKEQLWLIEQLVHRLQEDSIKGDKIGPEAFKSQLAKMANDPEIQEELQNIEREFAVTEENGLEGK